MKYLVFYSAGKVLMPILEVSNDSEVYVPNGMKMESLDSKSSAKVFIDENGLEYEFTEEN